MEEKECRCIHGLGPPVGEPKEYKATGSPDKKGCIQISSLYSQGERGGDWSSPKGQRANYIKALTRALNEAQCPYKEEIIELAEQNLVGSDSTK